MRRTPFKKGDRVLHPRFGFGVIESRPAREHDDGKLTHYYCIRLTDGGLLTVPVARAEEYGLRRIANGLASIRSCLRSNAHPLPDNPQERVLELTNRWQDPQALVLVRAVRDLARYSRKRTLTPGDKRFLVRACERLSSEAAMVDSIDVTEARAAIDREVQRLMASKSAQKS